MCTTESRANRDQIETRGIAESYMRPLGSTESEAAGASLLFLFPPETPVGSQVRRDDSSLPETVRLVPYALVMRCRGGPIRAMPVLIPNPELVPSTPHRQGSEQQGRLCRIRRNDRGASIPVPEDCRARGRVNRVSRGLPGRSLHCARSAGGAFLLAHSTVMPSRRIIAMNPVMEKKIAMAVRP